jgi:hypothetical protein
MFGREGFGGEGFGREEFTLRSVKRRDEWGCKSNGRAHTASNERGNSYCGETKRWKRIREGRIWVEDMNF